MQSRLVVRSAMAGPDAARDMADHMALVRKLRTTAGRGESDAESSDAEMADNIAVARREEAKVEAAKTEEEAAAQMASMRLAYQDLTTSAEKQKKELAKMDPKKAEQMERLGMGFGGGAGLGAGIQSHSLSSSVIVQVRGWNENKKG